MNNLVCKFKEVFSKVYSDFWDTQTFSPCRVDSDCRCYESGIRRQVRCICNARSRLRSHYQAKVFSGLCRHKNLILSNQTWVTFIFRSDHATPTRRWSDPWNSNAGQPQCWLGMVVEGCEICNWLDILGIDSSKIGRNRLNISRKISAKSGFSGAFAWKIYGSLSN